MTSIPLSDPADVAGELPPVNQAVVLLDFDGTLSHLVDDPDAAAPVDGVGDAVAALARQTRVLFVSGRSVDNLRARLPDDLDVTFVGGHGAEQAHGQDPVEPRVPDVEAAVEQRDDAIAQISDIVEVADGWVIEVKPTGLAVHWRMVDDPGALRDRVIAILESHAAAGMAVTHGHDVVELRPAGVDKGVAVAALLEDEARTPVCFGDDVTDEDMFAVAVERGGCAVVVSSQPRETHAAWRLADPDDVVATLRAWATSDKVT